MTSVTVEFLIRRNEPEGAWFDLVARDMPEVLRPSSVTSEIVDGPGELRLRIAGVDTEINFEDPGIQITFHGPIHADVARKIVEEIVERLERHTGQSGRIVEL